MSETILDDEMEKRGFVNIKGYQVLVVEREQAIIGDCFCSIERIYKKERVLLGAELLEAIEDLSRYIPNKLANAVLDDGKDKN